MMMKQLFVAAAILLHGMQPYAQGQTDLCKQASAYESNNMLDPDPLSVRSLRGRVIAEVGDKPQQIGPLPGACLGLFSEDEHRLIATETADHEGRFQFGKIPNGKYRLVVRIRGFCTANVPLQIANERRSKIAERQQLVIHMTPPLVIDRCSYGDYK